MQKLSTEHELDSTELDQVCGGVCTCGSDGGCVTQGTDGVLYNCGGGALYGGASFSPLQN